MVKNKIMLVVVLLIMLGATFIIFKTKPNHPPQQGESEASNQTLPNTAWTKLAKTKELQSTYNVKKTIDLLGFRMVHLEHKQLPQQFITAEGVPGNSANLLFEKDIKLDFITLVANQLMALRKAKNKETLSISHFETLDETPLIVAEQPLSRRHVKVMIQLSGEKTPREYLATMVRYPTPGLVDPKNETVVIGFARTPDYQPTLLSALIQLQLKKP